jgi:hypothetical protein
MNSYGEPGLLSDLEECARIEIEWPGWTAWPSLDGRWVARRVARLPLRFVSAGSPDRLRVAIRAADDRDGGE